MLEIKQLWTVLHKPFCGHRPPFFLGKNLWIGYLGYLVRCVSPSVRNRRSVSQFESSNHFTTSSTILMDRLFHFKHQSRCTLVSSFGFNWHFSSNLWYWASFHVLIYKCVFFRKEPVQIIFFVVGLCSYSSVVRVPMLKGKENEAR